MWNKTLKTHTSHHCIQSSMISALLFPKSHIYPNSVDHIINYYTVIFGFLILFKHVLSVHHCQCKYLVAVIWLWYGIPEILKIKKNKKCLFFVFLMSSHMTFSSVLSFLLSTHIVDCAVPLLLSIHMLIVHFFFRSLR